MKSADSDNEELVDLETVPSHATPAIIQPTAKRNRDDGLTVFSLQHAPVCFPQRGALCYGVMVASPHRPNSQAASFDIFTRAHGRHRLFDAAAVPQGLVAEVEAPLNSVPFGSEMAASCLSDVYSAPSTWRQLQVGDIIVASIVGRLVDTPCSDTPQPNVKDDKPVIDPYDASVATRRDAYSLFRVADLGRLDQVFAVAVPLGDFEAAVTGRLSIAAGGAVTRFKRSDVRKVVACRRCASQNDATGKDVAERSDEGSSAVCKADRVQRMLQAKLEGLSSSSLTTDLTFDKFKVTVDGLGIGHSNLTAAPTIADLSKQSAA